MESMHIRHIYRAEQNRCRGGKFGGHRALAGVCSQMALAKQCAAKPLAPMGRLGGHPMRREETSAKRPIAYI